MHCRLPFGTRDLSNHACPCLFWRAGGGHCPGTSPLQMLTEDGSQASGESKVIYTEFF